MLAFQDMWDNKNSCQSCRGCCKFREDETYFAPVFSTKEIETIRGQGLPADNFKPHKHHTDVFQVQLIRSTQDPQWYVCPYLDEGSHLCGIYQVRPTDCRIWPLLMMRDKENKEVVLSCFHKRICTTTDKLTEQEFELRMERLENWFDKEEFVRQLQQSPGLAWDYEPDTFHVRTLTQGCCPPPA
jgi:Fe-S-cluster containining protein